MIRQRLLLKSDIDRNDVVDLDSDIVTVRPRLAADYGSSCREMKPHNIDTDNVLTMIIIPECSWPVIGQTAVTQPSHWSLRPVYTMTSPRVMCLGLSRL